MKQRHKLSSFNRQEAVIGYIFSSPWIIGFILFTMIPFIQSIRFSFMDYNILQTPKWIGCKNYIDMVNDPIFWKSLGNTFYYVIFSVPLSIVIGLFIALLLNMDIKGMSIYRTLYYMPSIVPTVASSILWLWMFNPNFGILTNFVEALGFEAPAWLADPKWAKPSLILMSLWGAGGGMIIYLAGLKNIPNVYYEAAELDGAGWWKKFAHITLPMLSPTLFFQLIMGMIGAFQVFTQAFMMTEGGPNDATRFYLLYLYENAFKYWKMGYASSMAWILFVIIMFFTWINFKVSKYWVYYDQA